MIQKAQLNQPLAKYIFLKNKMNKRLAIFYSTGAYWGYAPFAPGTFGTILGLLLFLFTNSLKPELQIVLFFFSFIIAIPSVKTAIAHFDKEDPPQVIIDEILGIWLTLILFETSFKNLVLGFIFFRLFDIVKPFPVGYIDRKLKGAWGVICDDLAAGLMAKGLLWIIYIM